MKKSFIVVLFALIASVSYAQEPIPDALTWSVKGGINFSNWTQGGDTKARIGYKIGGGAEYSFTNLWSVQAGLYLTSKGTKIEEENQDLKVNQVYLELPVMGAARFGITDDANIVISAGPYIAYGITGKTKITGLDSGKINTYGDLGVKRFDLGFGLGVTGEIGRILVGIEGQYGFIKTMSYAGDSPRNMNFSITAGYKF